MPNQQDKIDWPGSWAIVQAAAYANGLSSDRSGLDAIESWAETATPEELDWLLGPVGPDGKRRWKKGYAAKLGAAMGWATFPLWQKFWRWFFDSE